MLLARKPLLVILLPLVWAACADPVSPDAGVIDAAPDASISIDAEPLDAEPLDAEPIDAEPIDADPIDTGPRPDTGFAIRSGSLAPAAGVAESPAFHLRGGLTPSSPGNAQSPEHRIQGGLVPASPRN